MAITLRWHLFPILLPASSRNGLSQDRTATFPVGSASELASGLQYLVPEADMKEANEDKKNRRRSERLAVSDEVKGRIKPTMEVRILNISQHGMLIESPCGLPPKGICELTIEAPGGPRLIKARVARCRAQMVKQDDGKVSIRFHTGLEFPEELAEGLEVQDLISEICTLEAPVEEFAAKASTSGIEQAM